MDATSFTYATRNIFLSVTVNHSFTGGDVWGPRNTERSFGADDNWFPQGFLQTSLDFQGIKEIFPCSLEMFSCSSCYCCPALYTTRVSPLLGLNLTSSSPLSPPPTQLWPFSSHCFPQIHPVLSYLRDFAQASAWNPFPDNHMAHFFPPHVKVFVPNRCSLNTLYLKCKLFPTILNHPSLLYHPPHDFTHLINYIFYLSVFCFLNSRR